MTYHQPPVNHLSHYLLCKLHIGRSQFCVIGSYQQIHHSLLPYVKKNSESPSRQPASSQGSLTHNSQTMKKKRTEPIIQFLVTPPYDLAIVEVSKVALAWTSFLRSRLTVLARSLLVVSLHLKRTFLGYCRNVITHHLVSVAMQQENSSGLNILLSDLPSNSGM